MRIPILVLILTVVAGTAGQALNLENCCGVLRVFGDVSSWMSTCFVVGDGSWVVAAAGAVTESTGTGSGQTIRRPIFISSYTGGAWQCEVKAVDKELGIALIKLPIKGLPAAPLAKFSKFSKCAYGTMGQVTSGEPVGRRWQTDIYGVVRETKAGTYRLAVTNWKAEKAIVSDADKSKVLFVTEVKPETAVPNGAMVARESDVVGMYINRIVITYGKQNVALGRCAMSSEIARCLGGKGIDTTTLYEPPAPTVKREDGASEAFQLRASIYSYIGAGRAGSALERAKALVSVRPGDADSHLLLGSALTGAGKFEEALKSFDEAAKLDPGIATLRTNRALALVGLKKRDEAEADLLKAIQDDPSDPRPATALADFYLGDEKTYDKALTYAEKAQSLSSASPAAHLLVARVQKRKKDYPAAVKTIQEALKCSATWPDAWYALGTTYEEAGDKTNAEKAYRKLMELQPKDPRSFLTLASFLLDAGRNGEASELIEKLREMKPPQAVLDELKTLEGKGVGDRGSGAGEGKGS